MNLRKSFLLLFLLINIPLFILTSLHYEGTKTYYLLYSIIAFIFFIKLTDNKSFLFENFIAAYFFLGYWFSFSLKLSFFGGNFFDYSDGYGLFDFEKSSFDHVLLICGISFISFLVANIIKDYFIKINFFQQIKYKSIKLFNNEIFISIILFLFIAIISFINFKFNIYQRGTISNTLINPLIINLFKWVFNFGYLVLISFFLFYLIKNKSKLPSILTFFYTVFEFLINLSLLSRGMIFNGAATLWGIKKIFKTKYFFTLIILLFVLTALFLINIFKVEKLRVSGLEKKNNISENIVLEENNLDRFGNLDLLVTTLVSRLHGFEAVMAVSAVEKKSFLFFTKALKEKNYKNEPSFFDKLKQDPRKSLKENKVSMTVPGLIAFLYYSGSISFLFIAILTLSLFFCYLEKIMFYFSNGNFIFVSIISQLSAYRLWHFGHNPSNSHLFLFSIMLSIFFIYLLNRIFKN